MKTLPVPERSSLTLGLMPLVDAAPLVVAQAAGYFAREGLAVELSCERAWASIRDKVATGMLDGAQMLAPMPLAATLGLDPIQRPMLAAAALNQGGSSICVSSSLHRRLLSQIDHGASDGGTSPLAWAQALRRVMEAERGTQRPLTLAHVFPYSTHHYDLRWWLASAGIHPDRDLNLVAIPPSLILEQLQSGHIDGCCVGSPWPQMAQDLGSGQVLFGKQALWSGGPEKVFGVTQAWAHAHPATLQALLRALIEAGRWLDDPAHHAQAAEWMCDGGYLTASRAQVLAALSQLRFHEGAAGFPWRSHALWLLSQMRRWNHTDGSVDPRSVAYSSYRPDLYREAAQSLGIAAPIADEKLEGAHAGPYRCVSTDGELTLPADRHFDGGHYDPRAP